MPGLPTVTYVQPGLSSPAIQPQSVWFMTLSLSPRLQGLIFLPTEQSFSHLVQECPIDQKPGTGMKSRASMSWTVDSAVKSTWSSCSRPGFNSQHTHNSSQPFLTEVLGGPRLLTFIGTRHTCGNIYTCKQSTHTHKIIKYINPSVF